MSGLIAVSYSNQILKVSQDGTQRTQLTHSANKAMYPCWSPGGDAIVYVDRASDQSSSIRLMAADGSGDHPLTNSNDPPINMIPRWSPDTQSLAYVSGDHIWTMKVDGTGKKQITSGNFIDLAPTYAPDGQHIAFSSNRSGTFNLWVMSADGTIMTQMTHTTTDPTTGFPIEQKAPVWSPDFRTIAYFQGVGDNNLSAGLRNGTSGPTSTDLEIFATWNIWLMDSNGSNQRLLVPGDDPAWSPDSSKILRPTLPIYSFTPPEVTGVGTINIDGTGRTTLFTTGTGPSGFSWQGGA